MKKTSQQKSVQNNAKPTKAFTLVEMLITISVFMVFIGMIMNTFLLVTNSQKDTNAVRKMAADVRILVEHITDVVGNGSVDYACYEGDPACLDQTGKEEKTLLAILNTEGTERTLIRFHHEQKNITIEKQYWEGTWTPGEEQALNADAEIENLSFLITPNHHPYSDIRNDAIQFQPKVSVFLTARPAGLKRETEPFNFQTTFSMRNL